MRCSDGRAIHPGFIETVASREVTVSHLSSRSPPTQRQSDARLAASRGKYMGDSLASNDPSPQKRRSTRVVQAIPLTVTGVDALGQPFKERTSTIVINCHGCRYQSKHYVPKNSQVTLEIPRPEPDKPLRVVHGRVVWVQRPRTVRELFQIGAEFRVPGNVWGIAFPPDDWFAVPEELLDAASVTKEGSATGVPSELWKEGAPAPESKIRVVPGAAQSEMSLAMAHQMARLLAESKQYLQRMTHEGVAAEIHATREQLEVQLRETVERAVQAAVPKAAEQAVQQAVQQRQAVQEADLLSISAAVADEVREARRHLDAQLQATLEKALEAAVPRVAEEAAQQVLQQGSEQLRLANQTEPAAAGVLPLTEDWDREIEEIGASRLAEWRRQTEEVSGALFQVQLDQFHHQLGTYCQEALKETRARMEQESADVYSALEVLRTRLEEERQRAVASLGVTEQASARAEETAAHLETAAKLTLEEARRRMEEIAATRAGELERRVDGLVAERIQKLEPELETTAQQVLDRIDAQVEQKCAPHLERAQMAVAALQSEQQKAAAAVEALRPRADDLVQDAGDRIGAACDNALRELGERVEQQSAELTEEFGKSCRAALCKLEEELDAKSTEATHTTFEALYKAAEWYQKKAQTTMQASFEKVIEQAGNSLRDRASDLSRMFAAELDNYSRNYVEHTRGLLDETAKEAGERSRHELEQVGQTTAAFFSDELHRKAKEALDQLEQESRAAVEALHQDSLPEFNTRLNEQIQAGVNNARDFLQAQFFPMIDSWKAQWESEQSDWLERIGHASGEAVEAYKSRLENASNSWLLASSATFGQRSQAMLESMATTAEQRLRETCAQVLAAMGEMLRLRLVGLSSSVAPADDPLKHD